MQDNNRQKTIDENKSNKGGAKSMDEKNVLQSQLQIIPQPIKKLLIDTISTDVDNTIDVGTKVATKLATIIKTKRLFVTIKGKDHVYLEGWTTMGAIFGLYPCVEWSRKVQHDKHVIFESRASIKTLDGRTMSTAESQCSTEEANQKGKEEYAIRSMSETRACSKAYRLALSWVMVLAGYHATPAEEVVNTEPKPAVEKTAPKSTIPEKDGLFQKR